MVASIFGGGAPAPPRPPPLSRPPAPIYWFFIGIPKKQTINGEAGGRLKGGVWGDGAPPRKWGVWGARECAPPELDATI